MNGADLFSSPLLPGVPEMSFPRRKSGAGSTDLLSSPLISGVPEMSFPRRKSVAPDLRWGGVGGGGAGATQTDVGAHTPTLALPTRGREDASWLGRPVSGQPGIGGRAAGRFMRR